MKRYLHIFTTFSILFTTLTYADSPKIGALIQEPRASRGLGRANPDYKDEVGKMLGIRYMRLEANVPNFDPQEAKRLQKFTSQGYKIVLHLINKPRGAGETPADAVKDIGAYKKQVSEILDAVKPELIAVENEELADKFFAGTPAQYLPELNAACEVAHQKHIKCTDGGITTLQFVTYLDLKKKSPSEAEEFGRGSIPPAVLKNLESGRMGNPKRQQLLDDTYALMDGLKSSSIDYANFHWYGSDPKGLAQAVDYLRRVVGKEPITTEIGQHDTDVQWVKNITAKAYEIGLPYIIWYSGDGTHAFALQDSESKLRPSGEAFKEFVQRHPGI